MFRSRSELRGTFFLLVGALVLATACGGSNDGEAADAASQIADAAIADAAPDATPPDATPPDASIFPVTLEETGLYSDFANEVLADGVLEYTPAWPLWSDGATKRRWIQLPEGSTIDTSNMDFWVLPEDTKLWKEFTLDGQRMETRLLWKAGPAAADWYYMSFAWDAGATEAVAVPDGVQNAHGTTYDIPRERDCRTCHERQPDFALGFSAVQLAHQSTGVNLDTLIADSRLTVPPTGTSPYFEIPGTGDEQAALGYFHGNCGGCHHPDSDVQDTAPGLLLRMEVAKLATVEETTVYTTAVGAPASISIGDNTCSDTTVCTLDDECAGIGDEVCINRASIIEPGSLSGSSAYLRMADRGTNIQMPPKGSEIVDTEALAVLEAWILSLAN